MPKIHCLAAIHWNYTAKRAKQLLFWKRSKFKGPFLMVVLNRNMGSFSFHIYIYAYIYAPSCSSEIYNIQASGTHTRAYMHVNSLQFPSPSCSRRPQRGEPRELLTHWGNVKEFINRFKVKQWGISGRISHACLSYLNRWLSPSSSGVGIFKTQIWRIYISSLL